MNKNELEMEKMRLEENTKHRGYCVSLVAGLEALGWLTPNPEAPDWEMHD